MADDDADGAGLVGPAGAGLERFADVPGDECDSLWTMDAPTVVGAAPGGGLVSERAGVGEGKSRRGSGASDDEDWDCVGAAPSSAGGAPLPAPRPEHSPVTPFTPSLRSRLVAAAAPASEASLQTETLLAFLAAPARRGAPSVASLRPLPALVCAGGRLADVLRAPTTVSEAVLWLQSCCPRHERAAQPSFGGGGGPARGAAPNPAAVAVMAAREALRQCGVVPDFSVSFAVKRQRVVDAAAAGVGAAVRGATAASGAAARSGGLTRLECYTRVLSELADDESYRMTVQVCRMDVADTQQASRCRARWA